MDICPFVVADPKTTILMQPRQSAFHNPKLFSKAAAIRATWLPEQGHYQSFSHFPEMGRRIYSPRHPEALLAISGADPACRRLVEWPPPAAVSLSRRGGSSR